jgi:hypothetical protein
MKSFKKEIVENPKYRIFVLINDEYGEFNDIQKSIFENGFVVSGTFILSSSGFRPENTLHELLKNT